MLLDQINGFYTALYQRLEEKRNEAICSLQKNLIFSQQTIQSCKSKNDGIQAEFQSIKKDIEENYENIIKKIEMEPFNQILSKYYGKLEEFSGKI